MPKALYLAYSMPVDAEHEPEYQRWYNEVHIPEVLDIDGFVSCSRYRLAGERENGLPLYVAVYQMDSDDLDAPIAELRRRFIDGEMTMSDSIQMVMEPVPGGSRRYDAL